MFSSYDSKLPSKPVVGTSLTAQAEVDAWLAESNWRHVVDQEGTEWELTVDSIEKPAKVGKTGGVLEVSLRIGVDVTAETLLETGVLDRSADQRLIDLLGSGVIPLRMRPQQLIIEDRATARTKLAAFLEEHSSKIKQKSLLTVKRSLVARWVERSRTFGVSSL